MESTENNSGVQHKNILCILQCAYSKHNT